MKLITLTLRDGFEKLNEIVKAKCSAQYPALKKKKMLLCTNYLHSVRNMNLQGHGATLWCPMGTAHLSPNLGQPHGFFLLPPHGARRVGGTGVVGSGEEGD